MAVNSVTGSNSAPSVVRAQSNRQADDTKAENDRRRVEAENQKAAQRAQQSSRGTNMDVAV